MSTTLTRVVTALAMIFMVAATYFLYPAGISLLIVVIGMLAVYEGIRMQYTYFWQFASPCLMLAAFLYGVDFEWLFGVVSVLYFVRLVVMFGAYRSNWIGHFLTISQFLDLLLLTQALSILYQFQPLELLYTIITLSGIDSFAYFAGKRFGKNRIVPMISPNKTLEGYLAAAVWMVFVGSIIMILKDIRILILTLCIVMVYLLAITGDLLVSYQKRILNVKDTGAVLPGHGGFLDRIDSWMYVVPFICWVLNSN